MLSYLERVETEHKTAKASVRMARCGVKSLLSGHQRSQESDMEKVALLKFGEYSVH